MSIKILVNDLGKEVKTYQDVITFASKFLVAQDWVEDKYINSCIEREKEYPTGLLLENGFLVAIPHGNSDFVKIDSLSIVRTLNSIEWGKMEDKNEKIKCNFIINLALHSSDSHIRMLTKLLKMFQNNDFVEKCQNLTKEELISYIRSQNS